MNRNIHATRALVALGIALAIAQTAYAQPGPAAPTNVTATAVSDTQIDISWTDAPDEDYYYIYRDGALWAGVSDGSTSVSDRTRSPNTTYSYYIRSWWSAEDLEGPASNTATATTKPVHAWSSSSFSLTGPSNGMTMTTYSFDVTTPASCNWGHSIQYQIQWDGVNSEMGSYGQTHFTHSWSSSGTYAIRGKSYCSGGLSNGDINTWISLMTVSIGGHVVNAPTTPTGTTSGNANTSYSYTAGNATDTLAHAISSYQFDWGDGTLSGWGAATQSHSWSSAGTYAVKAQAKCSAGLESAWSTTLNVSITAPHTLTSPTTPSGTANGSLNTSYSYSTGSSTCNQSHAVQYRFDWGDGSAQVLGSATQSHTWTTAATYSVKAQAQCSGGVTSSWSTALSVTISSHSLTLPSTPSGPLTACPNIASSYSTGSSTCNQSHAVQYRFDWGDGSAQVLGSATQSHTWTTAATRIVKAQAQCSAGVQSLWSNSISVVVAPDTTAPTVPGSLTATAISTSQINLSWTASTDSGGSGLAGYKIERSTNGSTFTQIATVSGAGTSYSSTGLVAGTRYYYQTRAYDLAGNNSAYTSIASDWTELMNPTTPSGLTATAVLTSQINLSWTASTDSGGSGLAGYKIERSTSGLAGTFSQIATAPATTYSNTGLTASKRYYYKVRAYDNAGNNSAYTSTVNALTPAVNETTPPSTPGGLTATAMSTSQINLSWTASTDTGGSTLAGYKIERSTDGVTFSQIATTTTTTYSNIELLTGTRYYYQVRAYDLAGNNSAYTSIASDWTDVTAPPVPTGFAATAVDTTIIDVSWTAPVDQDGSGIAGYKLQRSTSSSGPFSQIVDTPATIYSDTGRTPGTTYYYKVCAYDNAGNQGLFTSAVQSTTPTSHTVSTPLVPTGVAHTITEVLRTYTVSNSVCSLGHPLKYEFEWGDGSPNSPPDPSTVRNHVFSTEGTFSVKARASCDWKLSFFSNPLSVTVQNSGIITGDDINVPVYLPFDFKYAGTSYPGGSWPLRVCTNGWVSLTSSATSGPPAGLPTTSVSDVIAGFWDDLKPTGGSNGVVSWAATPSELVITWNAAAYYRNTSAHATFAITLKSDSTIDLTYGAVDLTTYYVQGFQYGTSWGKTWATSGAPQPRTIQNFYCFSTNTPYELIYGYKTDGTSTTNPLLVDTNRIDVVFVGDGFPIGDLTLFQNKTKDTADAARLTKPIADQLSMFNFWRVLPIAPTSGTSTMEIFRDPFIWYDEGRRKITNASSVSRAGNITCVLANSTSLNRGKSEMGGNGSVLVWGGPNITRFQQLFVHEFGHALGGLGDEYISEKGFAKSYNEPRDSTTKTLAPVLTLTVTYTADSTNPPRPFIVRPRLLYDYLEYSAVWINKVTNGVRTQVAYFDNSSSSFFYKEHCGTCPAQAAGHQPHDLATPPVEFPFTPTAPNDVYEVNLWTVGMISELWVDVDHSSVCSDGSLPPNLTTCRDTTKWRSGDTDPEFGDGTLHVYSGALESPFGIWRPTRNKCLMSEHDDENDPLRYCLVCRNAISQRMTQPYPN